jgi:hypothetical protein
VYAPTPNPSIEGTSTSKLRLLAAAPHVKRVCRAWHRTSEVKVLVPGVREAEGEEKGKGVVARRGLKEAPSKRAGRRTGTG